MLPVPRRAGDNTDLPSDSNVSKMVRANIAFTKHIFKRMFNELSNGMQVDRLWTVVILFKVCGIIGISKIELNKIKKMSKPFKTC